MTKEVKRTGIKSWPEDDRPREKLLKREEKVPSHKVPPCGIDSAVC